MGLFGKRKAPVTPPPSDPMASPGHQAVLRHLTEKEREAPGIREQVAGEVLCDFAYRLLQDERGVRLENMLAMLASVGGQQCLAPIVKAAGPKTTLDQMGLMGVKGNDGRVYLFGDAPNRLLLESHDSLLSLAFGTAQALGAPVTMDMIHGEMRKVASRAGGPEFETLELPEQHRVDRPSEWARLFGAKIVEALDTYEVPPMRRATAIGYAVQKAMEMGHKAMTLGQADLDPLTAARIVLQCATRTSKVLVA